MIKTSAFGVYDISVDGGNSFCHKTKNLILNNYYEKTALSSDMTLIVGSDNTPPDLTDTGLVAQFGTSGVESGFESLAESEVFVDRFEIKYSRLFDFGTGYTGTIRELGMLNPDLCSRALLSAPDGNPTEARLYNTDHLVIRYSLVYVVPRTPEVFALTINGTPVNATITAVNGDLGAWGTTSMAEIIKYAKIGSASTGTWAINANGDIVGANISNGVPLITNINGISGLTFVGTATVDTSEWVGSFQQLLITSAGNNFITAPILIDLDVPVTKTTNDITNISISVNQAP